MKIMASLFILVIAIINIAAFDLDVPQRTPRCENGRSDRVFFIHNRKAGGTTVRHFLGEQQHCRSPQLFRGFVEESTVFNVTRLKEPGTVFITVLREPISRIIRTIILKERGHSENGLLRYKGTESAADQTSYGWKCKITTCSDSRDIAGMEQGQNGQRGSLKKTKQHLSGMLFISGPFRFYRKWTSSSLWIFFLNWDLVCSRPRSLGVRARQTRSQNYHHTCGVGYTQRMESVGFASLC